MLSSANSFVASLRWLNSYTPFTLHQKNSMVSESKRPSLGFLVCNSSILKDICFPALIRIRATQSKLVILYKIKVKHNFKSTLASPKRPDLIPSPDPYQHHSRDILSWKNYSSCIKTCHSLAIKKYGNLNYFNHCN